MTPPLWQQAFVQWVRLALAPYDTPAPISPATTPQAYQIPVILADQRDVPRPVNPNGGVEYAAVRFLSDRSIASLMRDAVWDSETEILTTTTHDRREGTVSISVYGPRSSELADAIACSVDDEELTAPLASADVALGTEVGRQTGGVASGNVTDPREVIDYRFRRTASIERTSSDVIEHAALNFVPEVNGELDEAALEILIPAVED